MNAATFARKRARIERQAAGRASYRERAMRHLVREAGAALVIIERKFVGYRLPNGEMVCVKERYYTSEQADAALQRIVARSHAPRVPVRVYYCEHCYGYHLTSQRAKNTQALPEVRHEQTSF